MARETDKYHVYRPLLDLIGFTEGTDKGRGYNETLAYGKMLDGKGSKPTVRPPCEVTLNIGSPSANPRTDPIVVLIVLRSWRHRS